MPDRDSGKPRLGSDSALVADLLKLLLKIRCKEAEVAPKLIGKADHLEALAAGVREGLPMLAGWRYERSEEHTSELQSLMRISYAVFCLKKKHKYNKHQE